MQVFEDDNQRLVQALAQQDALDRVQRPPLLDLPVHLRKRVATFDDSKQRKEVRNCVFEGAIQREYLAVHFLAPGVLIFFSVDLEVTVQKIDYRQKCRSLAVQD